MSCLVHRMAKHQFLCGFIVLMMGFSTFMTCVSAASALQGVSFFLYQLFAVLLSGVGLVRALKLPTECEMETITWGYGLGLALAIVQYFMLAAVNRLDLAFVMQCIVSAAAAGYLAVRCWRKKVTEKEKIENSAILPPKRRELFWVFCFLVLNLTVRFFTYYGRNLLPEAGHNVVFPNQDLLFYIGNAISAGKGFPVQEFRFAGVWFRYHYFGSLLLEMASRTTGISELVLEFCFSWVQMPFLLIAGFWCLLRRMGVRVRWIAAGEFLLLFTTGWELVVYIAFQEKMYVSPFGYDVGLAFALLSVTYALVQCGQKRIHWGNLAAACLTFAVCTGAKAPVAVVILAIWGGLCGIWMLREKKPGQALACGLPMLGIFLLLFFTVVSDGMSTVSHNQTGLYFSLTGHLYECGLGSAYFSMVEKGIPQIVGKLLILLAYLIGANPVIYGLFYPAVFCRIKRKKMAAVFSFEGMLALSVAVGMLLTLFTKQSGNSQMYFAMTTVPLAAAYDALWLTERKEGAKGARFCFGSAAALLLIVSVGCWFHILWVSVESGYEKLAHRDHFEDVNNSLTWDEYEAYLWIGGHTEEDAVMLCNAPLSDSLYQNFVVGVCTRRQMWMEGWRYVAGYLDEALIGERREALRNAYMGGDTARIAREAGAEYCIWIRRYNPEAKLSLSEDSKIFDNGSVAVYRVEEGQQ